MTKNGACQVKHSRPGHGERILEVRELDNGSRILNYSRARWYNPLGDGNTMQLVLREFQRDSHRKGRISVAFQGRPCHGG